MTWLPLACNLLATIVSGYLVLRWTYRNGYEDGRKDAVAEPFRFFEPTIDLVPRDELAGDQPLPDDVRVVAIYAHGAEP